MHCWLRQKIHPCWHIAAVALGVVGGTTAALVLPAFLADPAWIAVAGIFLVPVLIKRSRWLLGLAFLVGISVGSWRGGNELLSLRAYQPYYGQTVQLKGVVREDVAYGKHGDLRFELSEVQLSRGSHPPGRLWISSTQKTDIKRGDIVTVKGRLDEGFGALPGAIYRATIPAVERPYPGDVARRLRDWFAEGVRQGIPEPQASLGIGYLTGQRSSLPLALDEQLQTVGLTHAVVASGYNLTILVSFARNVLAGISKYLAAYAAGFMVVAFVLVTGFSPSMTRAGLVSLLSLATWYYGRTIHPTVLLTIVGATTVLLRPAYAWGDIGWCLSFAAFIGVMVLAPLLQSYFWPPHNQPSLLAGLLVETVSAQLLTLPIVLYVFGQYAAYAVPANLLVIPLVPLAMLITFLAGVAGLAIPGLATIAGWPATQLLRYMTEAVERLAGLPGASADIGFNSFCLVGSYVILSLLIIWLQRKTGHDFRGGWHE